MSDREGERAERLRSVLGARFREWDVTAVTLVGRGLDAAVFRAESRAFGPVAIRVPWTRWISNDNDPSQDARSLLAVEKLLANHMLKHAVPTPEAFALHFGPDDFDFLVSAFIEDDGTDERPPALGAVIRTIHDAPVTSAIERALGKSDVVGTITRRVVERLDVVARLSGASLRTVPIGALREIVASAKYRPSVLHMDARRANTRVVSGDIRAILDWSNALIGDPALELARAAEYGVRDAAFDAGYGILPPTPAALETVYRLDTAVMLAVVFLSEAPDPEAATRQVARVQELLDALDLP